MSKSKQPWRGRRMSAYEILQEHLEYFKEEEKKSNSEDSYDPSEDSYDQGTEYLLMLVPLTLFSHREQKKIVKILREIQKTKRVYIHLRVTEDHLKKFHKTRSLLSLFNKKTKQGIRVSSVEVKPNRLKLDQVGVWMGKNIFTCMENISEEWKHSLGYIIISPDFPCSTGVIELIEKEDRSDIQHYTSTEELEDFYRSI